LKIGGVNLTTPGDVIVGGAAYVCGFTTDALFFSGGVTSGEVGAASMIGAIAAKYAAQEALKKLRPPREKIPPKTPPRENDQL